MSGWAQEYVDGWNSHDPERVAAFFAVDATYETVGAGPLWVVTGREAIQGMVSALNRFANDANITLLSEMYSGDRFALEEEETSTNTGSIARGVPATNKRYTARAAEIGRLDADGKIKEVRAYMDRLDIFTQLGLLAAPGA